MADDRKLTTQELVKIAAEADKAIAEAETARALSRLHIANAREAEAQAEKHEIELTAAREKELSRQHSDYHKRLYQFSGTVERASVNACMSQLREWDRLDPSCDIEVIFNSPGGSVIDGMALFDLLVRLSLRGGGSHKVTIGAQGYAASMAGILLQAGDVRWIGAQSYLMIHEISAGASGKIGEITDAVKFYDAICARVVDIFVERSGKISKAKFIAGWLRTDWWLMSDAALKLGFVDEVR
jgi:ATP-dependent Clp endopeptidase proteolytic subunit ClpP